jgi:hypothetical protein
MAIPSFDRPENYLNSNSRILALEVRDRNKPDGDPIAYVVVEREEKYCTDNSGQIENASIVLYYDAITTNQNFWQKPKYFKGEYSRSSGGKETVSITGGSVLLDLPGLHGNHIATYLMHEILTWAKQWPGATVLPVYLSPVDARDDDNKKRRNRLYEQLGLKFNYVDTENREGTSSSKQVSDLNNVESWKKNIRELDVRECIAELLCKNESLKRDLSSNENVIQHLKDEIKRATAKPICWALRKTGRRILRLLIFVVFGVVLANWIKQWSP